MEISTTLYFVAVIAIPYDGDQYDTVVAASIVHDGNRYDVFVVSRLGSCCCCQLNLMPPLLLLLLFYRADADTVSMI